MGWGKDCHPYLSSLKLFLGLTWKWCHASLVFSRSCGFTMELLLNSTAVWHHFLVLPGSDVTLSMWQDFPLIIFFPPPAYWASVSWKKSSDSSCRFMALVVSFLGLWFMILQWWLLLSCQTFVFWTFSMATGSKGLLRFGINIKWKDSKTDFQPQWLTLIPRAEKSAGNRAL